MTQFQKFCFRINLIAASQYFPVDFKRAGKTTVSLTGQSELTFCSQFTTNIVFDLSYSKGKVTMVFHKN